MSDSDSTLILKYLDSIVDAAFSFDLRSAQDQSFSFCELLLASSVTNITAGLSMDTETAVMVLLLSRCLEKGMQLDDVQKGAFHLCCRYSFARKEKKLFLAVTDLIKPESWHELDVTRAAILIVSSLLAMNVRFDYKFLSQFAAKLADIFGDTVLMEQQCYRLNILHLTNALVDRFLESFEDANRGVAVSASTLMDDVFTNLNKNDALVQFLKSCLLAKNHLLMQAVVRFIVLSCGSSMKIAEIYARDEVVECAFEALRHSHMQGCSNSNQCVIARSALECLDAIREKSQTSLSSKWQYGVETILNVIGTCVKADVETRGVHILKDAIRFVPASNLYASNMPRKVMEFSYGVVTRFKHDKEDKPVDHFSPLTPSSEEYNCISSNSSFENTLQFLVTFVEIVKLNFKCITAMADICDTLVSIGLENTNTADVIVAFLESLATMRVDTVDETDMQKLRWKVLQMIFRKVGVMVARKFQTALEDLTNSHRLALDAIDSLKILQSGLNCSLLFDHPSDSSWKLVLPWCWHTIEPAAIIVLGSSLNEIDNTNDVAERRKLVIRDYIYLLLNETVNVVPKMQVVNIPTNLTEFEKALTNFADPNSTDISFSLVEMSLDKQQFTMRRCTKIAIRGLANRVEKYVKPKENEKDFVRSICLLFRLYKEAKQSDSTRVQLTDEKMQILEKSSMFSIPNNIHLFLHLIAETQSTTLRHRLWEKYTDQSRREQDLARRCDEEIKCLLCSNQYALSSLFEVAVTQKVSNDLLKVIMTCFRRVKTIDFTLVSLQKHGLLDLLIQSMNMFAIDNFALGKPEKSTFQARNHGDIEASQLAALLTMAADCFCDWSDEIIQRLTAKCCECLRRLREETLRNENTVLTAILRFLIRLFEQSTHAAYTHFHTGAATYSVYSSVVSILKTRATCNNTEEHAFWYATANAACLLTLMVDFLKYRSINDELDTMYKYICDSCIEWGNLVCTLPLITQKTTGRISCAINCSVLFRVLLESHHCENTLYGTQPQTLKVQLLTSALSENLTLRHVVLLATVALDREIKRRSDDSYKLYLEISLFQCIIEKLHNNDPAIMHAEVVYACAKMEEYNEFPAVIFTQDIIARIHPTFNVVQNPFGLRVADIDSFKEALLRNQNRNETVPTRGENKNTGGIEGNDRTTLNCVLNNKNTRNLIFGEFAVIAS